MTPRQRQIAIAKAMILAAEEKSKELGVVGTVDTYEACKLIANCVEQEVVRQAARRMFGDIPALAHMLP